ncbi:hypothetical protein, partial [uncultured Tateyamaria sp.]|uniref:hypothetical protein n=1 Tax=uncultured Tateyamaria sp. TaxID=455651 RepID=UPI00260A7561
KPRSASSSQASPITSTAGRSLRPRHHPHALKPAARAKTNSEHQANKNNTNQSKNRKETL